MSGRLSKLIRWKEWGHSKIPPLFGAGSAWILAQPPPVSQALARHITWVLFTALFLACGYALNDYFDRDVDRKAGKPNAIGHMDSRRGLLWLAVITGAGIALMSPFYWERGVALLVAVCYVLGMSYSIPPLRFKERGVAGLLVSALAQRSMPLLVGMALFDQFDLKAWLLVLLFTLVGVRWILLHQLIDLPRDERSEVNTFARARGAHRISWLIKGAIFPLEVVCLLAWLLLAARESPALWLMVPAYAAWLLARLALWQGLGPAFDWNAYWLHPLGDFYEIFWPLFMGLLLAIHEPVYSVLLLFQLLWQAPYLLQQLILLHRLLCLKDRKGAAL